MPNDLIRRDAIRIDIKGWLNSGTDWRTLYDIVDGQPAVVTVPIVRCRDCIRRKTIRNGSHVCPYSTVDVSLDGFCHRGKRKDDVNGCK